MRAFYYVLYLAHAWSSGREHHHAAVNGGVLPGYDESFSEAYEFYFRVVG